MAEAPPPPRKSRRGLIITIIALVVVFVVGVGGYVGWSLTTRGTSYKVGDCVRQDGSGASLVGCTTSGSYRITSVVDTESGCTDSTQPSLVLTNSSGKKQYACLTLTGS